MSYRWWSILFLAVTCVCLGASMAFSALVDPYGLFNILDLEGFNRKKTAFPQYQRLGKVHAIQQLQPRSLLVGASQIEIGLDPAHPGLTAPCYNVAWPRMCMFEALRLVQHAHGAGRLEQVVLGVHTAMFRASERPGSNFREELLIVDRTGRPNPWHSLGRLPLLASADTLVASTETVIGQYVTIRGFEALILADGRRATPDLARLARQRGGMAQVFEDHRKALRLRPAQETWRDPVTGRSTFDLLLDLARLCRRARIDLRVIITPRHVEGCLPEDKGDEAAWRKGLVDALAREGRSTRAIPFPLYDFDYPSRYTTQPVPPTGDANAQLRWFWDPVHFRVELGSLILDRVFGRPGAPADWGHLLAGAPQTWGR
ncbi:MAG: hypothetical protein AB7T09_15880 [Planctomycetota bacterium]